MAHHLIRDIADLGPTSQRTQLHITIANKQLVPHKRPRNIRPGGDQAMIFQHQRVIYITHRRNQAFLFTFIQHDPFEIMIANPFEQLASFLHQRHRLYIQC